MARPSSWTTEDEQILKDNFPYISNRELRDKFFPNRPIRGIESKARKMKLFKIPVWTNEEITTLKENYGRMSLKELQINYFPNKTVEAISSKAHSVGIAKNNLWTDDEIDLMNKYYMNLGGAKFQELYMPYRKIGTIRDKAYTMGLIRRPTPEAWTKEEENILIQYNDVYSVDMIKEKFFPNRKIGQIYKKKKELGLKSHHRVKNGEFYWNEDRLNLLKELYPSMNTEEMHDVYFPEYSLSSIYNKVNELGLKKTEEFRTGWTQDEIEYCKNNYSNLDISIEDICVKCNKTPVQVAYMANNILHIYRKTNLFSEDELEIIKTIYPHVSTNSILDMFDGKDVDTIERKARRMGVRKTKDYIREATLSGTKNSLFCSIPQSKINNLLEDMGINYIPEFEATYYLLDQYLIDNELFIEVQGDFWHCSPLLKKGGVKSNIVKDKRKHTYIKNKYGVEILYLWETDVLDNIELCRLLIQEYINNNGILNNYHSFNYHINGNNELELNNTLIDIGY